MLQPFNFAIIHMESPVLVFLKRIQLAADFFGNVGYFLLAINTMSVPLFLVFVSVTALIQLNEKFPATGELQFLRCTQSNDHQSLTNKKNLIYLIAKIHELRKNWQKKSTYLPSFQDRI